jgi:hypothetical protein
MGAKARRITAVLVDASARKTIRPRARGPES